MRASEPEMLRKVLACLCAGVAFLCALFFCHWQFVHGTDSNGDVWGYLDAITCGRNTGWWAPVTLWEWRQIYLLLKDFGDSAFSWLGCDLSMLTPRQLFYFVYKCHIFLFAFSIAALVYAAVRRNGWNCLSLCFLGIIAFYMSHQMALGHRLDFFFLADITFLLLLLQVLGYLPRKIKWLVSIVFILILFQSVDVRKNAMLLVPCLLAALGWKMYPHLLLRRVVLLSMGASLIFVGMKKVIDSAVINTRILDSVHVMLLSDLRMASILEGRYEEYIERERKSLPKPEWVRCPVERLEQGSLELAFRRAHGRLQALAVSELEDGEDIYVHNVEGDIYLVIDEYVQALREHPLELLIARLITLDQFFWGANTSEWKRSLVERVCPATQGHPELWQSQTALTRWSGESWDNLRHTTLVLYAVTAAVLVAFLFRKRRAVMLQNSCVQNALLAVILGVVYLSSFLPVTPTPDFRYHYVPLVLFCYGTPILLIALLDVKNRKVSQAVAS